MPPLGECGVSRAKLPPIRAELRAELQTRAPETSRFDPPWTTVNIGRLTGGYVPNVIPGHAEVDWEMRPVRDEDRVFVKEATRVLKGLSSPLNLDRAIPLAVLLVIPLGLVGAVIAVWARGLENNIFFQVGLLTTMGLAAKNAILIVEFAELAHHQGKNAWDAALEAARLRFRPILMTSLAFIAGVVPLAIATGAGAQSRVAIGTAVIGGMTTATLLAIFLVPLFFVSILRLFGKDKPAGPGAAMEALA